MGYKTASLQMFAIVAPLFVAFPSNFVFAQDLEQMARDGYGVLERTSVNGEYQGCDFNRQIPLMDGLVFVCETYSYSYAYDPEVLILKNVRDGTVKTMINGTQVSGNFYRTTP